MIENYFEFEHTINRLRSSPANLYIDEHARWLEKQGYQEFTIREHLRSIAKFAEWVKESEFKIEDNDIIDKFRVYLKNNDQLRYQSNGKYNICFTRASKFIEFLKAKGVISFPPPVSEPPLLIEFRQWMLQNRGITQSSLDVYGIVINDFLNKIGDKPEQYTPQRLRNYVFYKASIHGSSRASSIVTSIRMFLRFLIAVGKCTPGLDHSIISVAQWRLSALPRFLDLESVEKVIASCDPDTPMGARDRAVILLLARLGLRASDVANLCLGDIDWDEGQLLVSGKNRRKTRLPLSQEVGDAILHYLKKGRPDIDTDRVFIKVIAPIIPITRQGVTHITDSAIRRAGIDAPSHGAHIFRHSAATAMLNQGVPLNHIGAVLRHSSIETTAHYAKIDINLLEKVVIPWPEVKPC